MGRSVILSYNDVVLRRSDLDILSGPRYLNDRIIEFYFSYLSSVYLSDVLLVPPMIAFWITQCSDAGSIKDFLQPLKLPGKRLVIFPVNDNDDVTCAEGGSHWSLLAYEKDANVFVHHDSLKGMNEQPALQLYKAVVGFMDASSATTRASFLQPTDTPTQSNGHDCGLYVTATARAICNWHQNCDDKDRRRLWHSDVKDQVTPPAVANMRAEILELIKCLMMKSISIIEVEKSRGRVVEIEKRFSSDPELLRESLNLLHVQVSLHTILSCL